MHPDEEALSGAPMISGMENEDVNNNGGENHLLTSVFSHGTGLPGADPANFNRNDA